MSKEIESNPVLISTVSLELYIKDNFKSQAAFAKAQGIKPQQVTQWLDAEYIVVTHATFGDTLYSRRRQIKTRR